MKKGFLLGNFDPQTPRDFEGGEACCRERLPQNSRRALLVGLASLGLMAHTPYGQWVAYRQKHLLIGSHRKDPEGYEEAKSLAKHLVVHLPDSRARVARARAPSRLASLLSTSQLDVVLLTHEDAQAMREAQGKLKTYGKIDLLTLVPLGPRSLLATTRFPPNHAWLVASALSDLSHGSAEAPMHPGAQAFMNGKPKPD